MEFYTSFDLGAIRREWAEKYGKVVEKYNLPPLSNFPAWRWQKVYVTLLRDLGLSWKKVAEEMSLSISAVQRHDLRPKDGWNLVKPFLKKKSCHA